MFPVYGLGTSKSFNDTRLNCFLLTTIITLPLFRMFTIKKKTVLTQLINSTVNLKDLMQEYCQTTCNIAFKSTMSSDIGC